MVIGLHGDSTDNVPRAVEEVHSIEREPAIIQHPPAEANIVLDHLSNQTLVIPMGVLVKIYWYFDLAKRSFEGKYPSFKNIKFPRATIRPIVPRYKHSIVHH